MFNLDPAKLLVIAVVAIILLGPDKLPQVARQVGKAWRSFNEFRRRMEDEVRSTMPDLPPSAEIARLARSPSALLTHLSNLDPEDETEGADENHKQEKDAVAGSENEAPKGSFEAPVLGDGAARDHDAPASTAPADAAVAPVQPVIPPSTVDMYPAQPHPTDAVAPGDPTLN